MEYIQNYVDFMRLGIEYNINLLGIDTRDERGAISTEMAVVIAALVAIAVVAGGIFMARARSNAENIPDSVPAPG